MVIKKEIAEIRKRFKIDRNAITRLRGCYVNSERAVIATFDKSFGMIPEDERFKYLAIFSKVLSGTQGMNLHDVEFTTQEVMHGDDHKLLMKLRESKLGDDESIDQFYRKIIDGVDFEGNYLIMLIHETYDIPLRGKDNKIIKDGSEEVYNYILCSVCPVNLTKPGLSYDADENIFHDRTQDWQVELPELGFLFPAFDDRSANIYNTLYYIKKAENKHEDFIQSVFSGELPMTVVDQKEAFNDVLAQSLGQSFNYDVVNSLQSEIRNRIGQSTEEEPLKLSGREIGYILSECGVESPAVSAFEDKFENVIGEEIPAKHLISTKTVIKTHDTVISTGVDNESGIEIREIGGRKYLLIPVDDNIEINGVSLNAV